MTVSEAWSVVGRDDLVDRLVGVVRRHLGVGRRSPVAAPAGAVVVGVAGVGKTALVAEVARGVAATAPGGADAAALVVRRVVATRVGSEAPLGALASLLPPDLAGRAGTYGLRADALRWAADEVMAGVGQLVLVVDDAHLLDDASASVVLHLVLGGRCALLATVRQGEPAPEPIEALWRDGLVARVDLEPLDHPATVAALGAALGGAIDGASARDLWSRSEGNPLLLRELVLAARADGSLRCTEGVWRLHRPGAPSARLGELIASRLGQLEPHERHVLELLAVGEPLGPDLLSPEGDTSVLDRLEERGLLTVRFDGRRGEVRLAHPLYGDVLSAAMPALRRRRHARSLADAVGAHGARRRGDVLRVGLWRLDGGGTVDADLMFEAARQALFAFEYGLAERLARAAVDATAEDDPRRGPAALLLGEVLEHLGRVDEADAVYTAAETAAADPIGRVQAAGARASNLFWGLGRADEAATVLAANERAVGDGPLRAELVAVRATLTLLGGDAAAALGVVRELPIDLLDDPEVMPPVGAERILVNASIAAACALAVAGRRTEAVAVARRAGAVHRSLGDQQLLARPWIHDVASALAATEAGPLDDADRVTADGYAAAIERREPSAQAWFALLAGRAALLRGRPVTAAARFRESAVLFDEIGEPGPRRWGLAGCVVAAALVGDPEEADAAATQLDAVTSPMGMMETEVRRAHAWRLRLSGRVEEANDVLADALRDARARGCDALAGPCGWDLVRFGAARRAAALLADHVGCDGAVGRRAALVVAAAAGDAATLTDGADALLALGWELDGAEALVLASDALARSGAARRAAALRHRAEHLAAAFEGARTPLLVAARAAEPLTPRERDIALLAAEGRTSKEIAARLHLSPRTVDNNLQRVFAKLGVHRRADLAEALGT